MQVFFVLFDLELKNILWAAESPIPYKTKKRGEREEKERRKGGKGAMSVVC